MRKSPSLYPRKSRFSKVKMLPGIIQVGFILVLILLFLTLLAWSMDSVVYRLMGA
jgi:hypothetical protein